MIRTRALAPQLVGGYRVAGTRYYLHAGPPASRTRDRVDLFVQRSIERGRPWLRFSQWNLFTVSAYRTLREAAS